MKDRKTQRKPKIAPLSNSFFLISIVGLYVSLIFVTPKSPDYGVAFSIVFGIMFIASMISLTYAPARALIKLEEYEKKRKGAKVLSHAEFIEEHKKDRKKK
ncbi:MAG: hypothetical protein ACLFNK_01865 [Candidatus Woesearchaeota archaeon]